MSSLSSRSKLFFKRNASTILTTIGGVGVIATSVMAVKATPKALELIEKAKEEKGEELTKMEVVKASGKVYIPAVLVGVSSLVCIFGANDFNKRQQASLISAYALLENSYKEYKGKLKELYGEEAHQNIINSIMVEKAENTYIQASCLCADCDLSMEESTGDPVLFYDEHSARYFEATIEQVLGAEYHLNRNYILRGYSYLNEFYEFLGLELTDYGSVLGWAPVDDGMYWIDFKHRKVLIDDELECYVIEMPYEPTYDFLEY